MNVVNKKKIYPSIHSYSDQDFVKNFVFNKNIVGKVLKNLEKIDESIKEHHLLFFLDYCKFNTTFYDRASKFNISSRTYSDCVWKVVTASKSLNFKNKFSKRLNSKIDDLVSTSNDQFLTLVVDSTFIPFATTDQSFYSGYYRKGNGRGVKFQVSCDSSGEVFTVHGQYKSTAADITIFRETLGRVPLCAGERFIADKGYVGESNKILCPHKETENGLTSKEKLENRFIKRNRLIIENVFGVLRRFKIMDVPWATNLSKLRDTFFFLVYIYNLSIRFNKKIIEKAMKEDEEKKDEDEDEELQTNSDENIDQFLTDCTSSWQDQNKD
ncbi:hypothetical protein ACTA71_008706 [Dictyostelium dimigraforme]